RGGGSLEDLWAFNEEAVARAIYECKSSVISAVGHEIDFTIADFVADLRAPTPSAAAELVVANQADVAAQVDGLRRRLTQTLMARLESARLRLNGLVNSYAMRTPLDRLAQARQRVDDLAARLVELAADAARENRRRLEMLQARLEALNPRAVLARGFAIVSRVRDGRVIYKPAQARLGEHVRIELHEGRLRAVVVKDEEDFLTEA
ncbi:MAG: exodeoxyribonuclease VII large subunit, partial [Candidatus Sumerlaeota bacterium]|nr:exodeoxyribonuclease VII large subunit [Candidatus Sumerlaeota bacterium]